MTPQTVVHHDLRILFVIAVWAHTMTPRFTALILLFNAVTETLIFEFVCDHTTYENHCISTHTNKCQLPTVCILQQARSIACLMLS